jgi:hypothetical protein
VDFEKLIDLEYPREKIRVVELGFLGSALEDLSRVERIGIFSPSLLDELLSQPALPTVAKSLCSRQLFLLGSTMSPAVQIDLRRILLSAGFVEVAELTDSGQVENISIGVFPDGGFSFFSDSLGFDSAPKGSVCFEVNRLPIRENLQFTWESQAPGVLKRSEFGFTLDAGSAQRAVILSKRVLIESGDTCGIEVSLSGALFTAERFFVLVNALGPQYLNSYSCVVEDLSKGIVSVWLDKDGNQEHLGWACLPPDCVVRDGERAELTVKFSVGPRFLIVEACGVVHLRLEHFGRLERTSVVGVMAEDHGLSLTGARGTKDFAKS